MRSERKDALEESKRSIITDRNKDIKDNVLK